VETVSDSVKALQRLGRGERLETTVTGPLERVRAWRERQI